MQHYTVANPENMSCWTIKEGNPINLFKVCYNHVIHPEFLDLFLCNYIIILPNF